MKRWLSLVVATVSICVGLSGTLLAQRRGGRTGSSRASSGTRSSGIRPSGIRPSGTRAGGTRSSGLSSSGTKSGGTRSVVIPHAKSSPTSIPRTGAGTQAARDAKGRIQRSAAARHAFARQTGFPNGRPGYVVDHIKPLACGGADAPSNMQWQTVAAAKAKDKVERVGCK